jgi:hypothetical protein
MRIDNAAVQRRIVMLVQEIAGHDGNQNICFSVSLARRS